MNETVVDRDAKLAILVSMSGDSVDRRGMMLRVLDDESSISEDVKTSIKQWFGSIAKKVMLNEAYI
jgi:hypothetical protein